MNRSRPAGLLGTSDPLQSLFAEKSSVYRWASDGLGRAFNSHTAALSLSAKVFFFFPKWSLDHKFGLHVTILRGHQYTYQVNNEGEHELETDR